MDKRFTRWSPLALVFVVLVAVAARQQQAASIGLVNIQAVMEQTPGFADARTTWEAELKQYQDELQRLQDTLNAKIADFDQQSVVLSPTARTEKQQEIQRLNQRVNQRAQELQVRSGERQRELLAPLENRVQAVVDGIRAERNLNVIFDVSSQGNNIISADNALDLTPRVIQRLQAAQEQ